MANKTSIRFFEDVPVRAVWDDGSAKWWFCAMDIAEALTKSTNPRVYWATVKRRNPQLIAICKQLKLKAKDGNDTTPAALCHSRQRAAGVYFEPKQKSSFSTKNVLFYLRGYDTI